MSAVIADNIFRGYDIRGQVPQELNAEGAYVLGRAYGTWLSQRRINEAIIVGDNRTHGRSKAEFLSRLPIIPKSIMALNWRLAFPTR